MYSYQLQGATKVLQQNLQLHKTNSITYTNVNLFFPRFSWGQYTIIKNCGQTGLEISYIGLVKLHDVKI